MISKEEEKNYINPKISKVWNFLIYGSTIAIGVFLIWLYSAYIFINKWKKVKKSGNVKRRNALLGKVGNVFAIIELVDSWYKLEEQDPLSLMELLHQIFPPWHIYLDVFLLGIGLYIYLRITKKINTK